jgi:hypothetical protein
MLVSTRLLLLMMAPLVGLGAVGVYNRVPLFAARAQREIISQPSDWVPFSAELRRVHEKDGSLFVGHYYRSSDGSTRSETGPSLDNITSIGIKNVGQATFYYWSRQKGWSLQPMDLPPWGWKPVRTLMNKKMTRVPDMVEGFALIRVDTAGRVIYQAPELNLFVLVNLVKCEWDPAAKCGTWYSTIKIAEPPREYFLPPSDQPIERIEKPGGIVRRAPVAR